MVVLNTGAAEVEEVVPVHFETDLSCVPNVVIHSDVEGEIYGQKVYDVLDQVPPDLRSNHSDFAYYRELRAHGGKSGNFEKLGGDHDEPREANNAWKLDKWKVLPSVEKATKHFPTAKWYIFLEEDSYMVWSNMLELLSKFDETKDFYLGGPNFLNSYPISTGSHGFVLSSKTAHSLSDELRLRREKYLERTAENCCGHIVIAKALDTIGVSMTSAFPIMQGDKPSTLNYTDRNWCSPVATFQHMSTDELREFWEYEQDWLKSSAADKPITYRDVFNRFVEVAVRRPRLSWDNMSRDRILTAAELNATDIYSAQYAYTSVEACLVACEEDSACLQYQYRVGECRLGYDIRLGQREASGIVSGWMTDRIKSFKETQEPCELDWMDG